MNAAQIVRRLVCIRRRRRRPALLKDAIYLPCQIGSSVIVKASGTIDDGNFTILLITLIKQTIHTVLK